MEMKSIESNQWKKRLLDEINSEKFSTIFKGNEFLSDEVDRFISKSLIYWKDGDERYLWFRFPKIIILVGEKIKEAEELFQTIVEKGNKINVESLKGHICDETIEYLQAKKLQHWKINLDKLDSLFLHLISGSTEIYEDSFINPKLAGPNRYSITKNSLIQNEQIYLLTSREEYLDFNKLIINNNINGDIEMVFLDSLEDYLEFAYSITLEYLANFGWLITNSKLKNSVLQYYHDEMKNGYFRGSESVIRLQNFISMHCFIPDKVYPWEETGDDKEWMTISGNISSKNMDELKKDNAVMDRQRLREALLSKDGYTISIKGQ